MPDPRQSEIRMTLPFLLKPEEQWGAGGYLMAHFQGHQDISHGKFSTGRVDVVVPPEPEREAATVAGEASEKESMLRLDTQVWLAPFDFGITQSVSLRFLPSDDPGYLAIEVRIRRLAGEVNVWGRANKAFLNDLRKQLLVWRSLDPGEREDFERALNAALGREEAEEALRHAHHRP
jgi:hypothetical protein